MTPISGIEAHAVKSAVELAGHDPNCFELSRELWRPFAQKELGNLSVDIGTVRLEPDRERCPEAYPLRFVSPEFGIVWADELGRSSLQQEVVQSVRDSRRHSSSPSDRSWGRYPLLIVEEADQWRVESYRPKHRGEAQQEDLPFTIHRRDSTLVNKEQFFFEVEPGSSVVLDALAYLSGVSDEWGEVVSPTELLIREARRQPALCIELAHFAYREDTWQNTFVRALTDTSHPCGEHLAEVLTLAHRSSPLGSDGPHPYIHLKILSSLTREQILGNPKFLEGILDRGVKAEVCALIRVLELRELREFIWIPLRALEQFDWGSEDYVVVAPGYSESWDWYFGALFISWTDASNDALTRPALLRVYRSMRESVLAELRELGEFDVEEIEGEGLDLFCGIQSHLGIVEEPGDLSWICSNVH